jgi:hypothetical protein
MIDQFFPSVRFSHVVLFVGMKVSFDLTCSCLAIIGIVTLWVQSGASLSLWTIGSKPLLVVSRALYESVNGKIVSLFHLLKDIETIYEILSSALHETEIQNVRVR